MLQRAQASVETQEAKRQSGPAPGLAGERTQIPARHAAWGGNQSRLRRLALQRKLAIGSVHDPLEAEADRVADRVMRMSAPSVTPSPDISNGVRGVRRQCSCGGTCSSCKHEAELQRKQTGSPALTEAPPIVHETLRSPGNPLDPAARAFMEPRFGRDFSAVRVHTDARAAESARQVDSLAYTVGTSIVFRSGSYDSHSDSGRRLLAHELTHVAQQTDFEHTSTLPGSRREAPTLRNAAPATLRRQPGDDEAFAEYNGPQPPAAHPLTQPLGWDELFHKVVSDQRAFLFTGPADVANPAVDPTGTGRGVGPDRTRYGTEVIAAIQILDRSGNRVAIGFGAHRLLPGGHAEEQALAGLHNELGDRNLSGGTMMVVVDQYPCGANNHNCGLQLRQFAQTHGLTLEVRVPLRERVNQSGVNASPRTASRGAFRTDLAQDPRTRMRLVTVDQQPAPAAPHGGPGSGGGGGGSAAAHTATHGAAPHGTAPSPAFAAPNADPRNPKAPKRTPVKAPPKAPKAKPVKAAPARPLSKPSAPTKSTLDVEPPQHGGSVSRASRAAVSIANRTVSNASQRFRSGITQLVRDNAHDKDLTTMLDILDKAADVESFVQNPRAFTAQAIKTNLIQGVFNHFANSLDSERRSFLAKFPDVSTLRSDPVGTGISLGGYEQLYNRALANLRLPDMRRALAYAFVLVGTDNLPDKEKEQERRIAMVNDAMLRAPGLDVYVGQYREAMDRYVFTINWEANLVNMASDELAELPPGFADELRRRGEALNKAGESLNQLAEQIMNNAVALVFDEVYGAGAELQSLGDNFERLGGQLLEFADLAGRRKGEYDAEIRQLQARGNKIAADASRPFLPQPHP